MQVRVSLLILSLVSAVVVGYSLYLEHYQNLSPCALCLMQRYCAAAICLVAFIASRRVAKGGWHAIMIMLLGLTFFGIYFSSRQLWLLSLPPESATACLPSLDTLIHYFPWQDVLKAIFMGTEECTHEQYLILGLSLPAWGMFYFVLSALVSGILIFFQKKSFSK